MCEECDFRIVVSPKENNPGHFSVELASGTILDNMAVVMEQLNNLGDNFVFPYDYLEQLIQSRKKIDNIIVLSDDTVAPGFNEMVGSGAGAGGLSGILNKYRQEINPDLLYVCVNLKGGKNIANDNANESAKKHPNDILVSGFSDAILKYVAERGDGNQLEYIQHIDVAKNLDSLSAKLELRLNRNNDNSGSAFWSFLDSVQNCQWEGCIEKVRKEHLQDHLKNCSFRLVTCTEVGCGAKVAKNQLDFHKSRCFFKKMSNADKQKWRNVRVFVSSTFLDMHGERDVLVKYVFPEIKAYCKSKRINFFNVDLRWGVTEGEDYTSIDVCLTEVDKCRPFFIGLLGDRYGWVPDAYHVSEDPQLSWLKEYPTGRSITELEIHFGALQHNVGVGSAIYIRDSAFSHSVPEEYRQAFISSPEDARKLEELKNTVKSSVFTQSYKATWGGVDDGKPSSSGLDEFRRLVTNKLKSDKI